MPCAQLEDLMKRVRYISRFTLSLSPTDIDQIVETSQKNNPRRNITGMLVASGDLFYQLLEGPKAEIDSLYDRISKDPRHEQILLLESEVGNFDRICPDWAMQKVDLSLKSAAETAPISALLEMICAQRKMAEKALKSLDEYTWEGLISTELQEL
jgi:adenylate cyclase